MREVTGGDRETEKKLESFLDGLGRGGFFQGLDRYGSEYAERRRKAIDKFVQKHGVKKPEVWNGPNLPATHRAHAAHGRRGVVLRSSDTLPERTRVCADPAGLLR